MQLADIPVEELTHRSSLAFDMRKAQIVADGDAPWTIQHAARRFEEARALKRSSEPSFDELLDKADAQPCPECDAQPGHDHASWCLVENTTSEADAWG